MKLLINNTLFYTPEVNPEVNPFSGQFFLGSTVSQVNPFSGQPFLRSTISQLRPFSDQPFLRATLNPQVNPLLGQPVDNPFSLRQPILSQATRSLSGNPFSLRQPVLIQTHCNSRSSWNGSHRSCYY